MTDMPGRPKTTSNRAATLRAEIPSLYADPYTRCPICYGNKIHPDFSLRSRSGLQLHWDKCHTCGFTFMNPRLVPEEMYKIYTTREYWETGYNNYLSGESIRLENAERRLNLCASYLPGKGRLLDLACATGFFAHVAASHGYDAIGVDLNAEMIDFGRERYGLDLRISTIEDCDFDLGSFDVISMWGLDCHFFDFRSTFARIVGWLKPGGAILFSYQDYAHWIRLIFSRIKQDENVYYNFTRDSFGRLMRQLGMEIALQRTDVQIAEFHRVTRSLKLGSGMLSRFDSARIRIPTLSFLIVVAIKEELT